MRIDFRKEKFNYDWWSLMAAYESKVTPDAAVLEIGASRPERTKALSRRCKSLVGLELMPERTPQDFDNVKYVTGDWQILSSVMKPGSIDVAVSSHVIEHVPDDLKAINELYKVLKPGGVALINTPNRRRLTRRCIELFTGPRQFPYWEHQREYDEADLSRLLSKSLFKRYEIRPLVFGLHGGRFFFYLENVPSIFRGAANYWELHLFKDQERDGLS